MPVSTHDKTAAAALERQWKRKIVSGNDAFALGDLVAARAGYLAACAFIDEHFVDWAAVDADNAVAARVVSQLNLAETRARENDRDAAAKCLQRLHQWLLGMIEADGTSAELRSIALRHAGETALAITQFQADYGTFSELSLCCFSSQAKH